jgi:hypothetical protein
MKPTDSPRILTTTVGSYPVPDWLAALPSEQALIDATRVVFDLQRQAGIDLPTDGELYRFDVNHPDTNGMIDYFVHKLGGVRREVGRRVPRQNGVTSKPKSQACRQILCDSVLQACCTACAKVFCRHETSGAHHSRAGQVRWAAVHSRDAHPRHGHSRHVG